MSGPEANTWVHDSKRLRWVVVGGSGFVGQGVVHAIQDLTAINPSIVRAPRLDSVPSAGEQELFGKLRSDEYIASVVQDLAKSFEDAQVVVNAAGLATPGAHESPSLTGANALLPIVIAEAAEIAGVSRLVHISSAAVQGRRACLDETSSVSPFSAYSESKATGEAALSLWKSKTDDDSEGMGRSLKVVIIRATSVQGNQRATSNSLQRIASSPLASVAAPAKQPSVVSSLEGLSSFVVAVGTYENELPGILLQPWEGASVYDVMYIAGHGRKPLVIPKVVALAGVHIAFGFIKIAPKFKGVARRLEVMWLGQDQIAGWAVENNIVAAPMEGPSDHLRRALG